LKTPLENITIHKQLAGGGFGGRYESYEIVQAVLLAKAMPGRPIKLIWSREDDILNDCYRPITAQHVGVGIGADNKIVGWTQSLTCGSQWARMMPQHMERRRGRDNVTAQGFDFAEYDIPAYFMDYKQTHKGIRIGSLRGTAGTYVQFLQETMLDE